MKIVWLGGWAMAPQWIESRVKERFRQHDHVIVYPGEYWENYLPTDADVYVGHSLGAFLLLRHAEHLPSEAQLILLAPFCDFRAESLLGGRVHVVQIKLLLRMLNSDTLAAVNDFYQRSGIQFDCKRSLPYSKEDLLWGIRQLCEMSVSEVGFKRVQQAIIGSEDKLLDPERIQKYCPSMEIIAGAGHSMEDLLPFIGLGVTDSV